MVMLILMTCLCFSDTIAMLYATWRLIKKIGKLSLPQTKENSLVIYVNVPSTVRFQVVKLSTAISLHVTLVLFYHSNMFNLEMRNLRWVAASN